MLLDTVDPMTDQRIAQRRREAGAAARGPEPRRGGAIGVALLGAMVAAQGSFAPGMRAAMLIAAGAFAAGAVVSWTALMRRQAG